MGDAGDEEASETVANLPASRLMPRRSGRRT